MVCIPYLLLDPVVPILGYRVGRFELSRWSSPHNASESSILILAQIRARPIVGDPKNRKGCVGDPKNRKGCKSSHSREPLKRSAKRARQHGGRGLQCTENQR